MGIMRKRLSTEEYVQGLRSGDRGILARAITLIESGLDSDRELANQVLSGIMPFTGNSIRVAVSGVPGAGKSTLIEAMGKSLTAKGRKIAVLAVDPSSSISSGSILGDKTRMEELSRDPLAFIRPSPTGSSRGGITRRTREAILLCEAAGYEAILIETVGVGQIETQVHEMVDCFVLVMLTGAGDELQMIKKGVMEIADIIVINKADGSNREKANRTRQEMAHVLKSYPEVSPGWKTKVLTASAAEKQGVEAVWEEIFHFQSVAISAGVFKSARERQNIQWMKEYLLELLETELYHSGKVQKAFPGLSEKVAAGEIPATLAAERLYRIFKSEE